VTTARLRLVVIVAVVAAATGGYRWWNSPERQIRRVLEAIAEDLSHGEPVSGLAAVAGVAALQNHFTIDVVIEPGRPLPPLSGRDAVMAAAIRLRAATPALRVEFADMNVMIDAGGTEATVDCRVTMTGPGAGQDNLDSREVVVILRVVDGQWMVARATAQHVMEPVT
jgi:hypothetical protein